MKTYYSSVITGLILCLMPSQRAGAEFLTDLSGIHSTVSHTYTYSLVNSENSDIPAVGLRINVDPSSNITSITSPTGWLFTYENGMEFVAWEASDPSSALLPGSSGQFQFVSLLDPIIQNYAIIGIGEEPNDFGFQSGDVTAPGIATVPEPSTFILTMIGLLLTCGITWLGKSVLPYTKV